MEAPRLLPYDIILITHFSIGKLLHLRLALISIFPFMAFIDEILYSICCFDTCYFCFILISCSFQIHCKYEQLHKQNYMLLSFSSKQKNKRLTLEQLYRNVFNQFKVVLKGVWVRVRVRVRWGLGMRWGLEYRLIAFMFQLLLRHCMVSHTCLYITSQTFGRTYLFTGFSLFQLFSVL